MKYLPIFPNRIPLQQITGEVKMAIKDYRILKNINFLLLTEEF